MENVLGIVPAEKGNSLLHCNDEHELAKSLK